MGELQKLESTAGRCDPLTWLDLPGASLTPFDVEHNIYQYGLRADREAALLFADQNPAGPFSWVQFSDITPARTLLIALGRTLVSHHNLIRCGRATP
jgi:hypothetical protein